MKTIAHLLCLGISLPLLAPHSVRAYGYTGHTQIVERAVLAMRKQSDLVPIIPPKPTGVSQADFDLYLLAVKNAPARLNLLRTGLPNKLQASGFDPIFPVGPGDEAYPFQITYTVEPDPTPQNPKQTKSTPHYPTCTFDHQDNLSDLSRFQIAKFSYFRLSSCVSGCAMAVLRARRA
jgi:hypothetical protein